MIVCNTRGREEIGNKNDRVDADRLSELLRLGGLKPVYHGASALLTLKELVRSYVGLVEDGTRVMLRIKALFRAPRSFEPGQPFFSLGLPVHRRAGRLDPEWIFPAPTRWKSETTEGRHHYHETNVQRAVTRAALAIPGGRH